MRITYCPWFDLLSSDIPVVLDLTVEWELGTPHLVIDNILDSTGKVSLMHHEKKAFSELAYLIADMAEGDDRLLAEAVAHDNDERMVA
jgi:hypothetical protein